jgi:transposase InsO family protein
VTRHGIISVLVQRSPVVASGEAMTITVEGLYEQAKILIYLRSDNGAEFVARALRNWLAEHAIEPLSIDPGCPW